MMLFGSFRPDLPTIADSGEAPRNAYACNVIPSALGYLPFPSFVEVSSAADSRVLSGASVVKVDGSVLTVIGDAGKLYDASGATLSNISVSGNYTISDTDDVWNFTLDGNNLLATHIDAKLQSFDLSSGTAFANHITSTLKPQGRYITTVGEFPILGNVKEGSTYYPNRVTWPSINNSADWERTVAKQSDYQDIKDSGHVKGLTGNKEYGVVVCEKSLHRMDYVGGNIIFQFNKIEDSIGTAVPRSVVGHGRDTFYYSPEGWMRYDGVSVRRIGAERIDRFFAADFDFSNRARLSASIDPASKALVVLYPGQGNVAGAPNKGLVFRYDIEEWSCLEGLSVECLFSSVSAGYTLEQLDNIAASVENLPASLDSGLYQDGRMLLGGASQNKKPGAFNGSPMTAAIDTAEVNLNPGRMASVQSLRPIVIGNPASVVQVKALTRDVPIADDSYNDSGYIGIEASGEVPMDNVPAARFHRFRTQISGGFTVAKGIGDIEISDGGVL